MWIFLLSILLLIIAIVIYLSLPTSEIEQSGMPKKRPVDNTTYFQNLGRKPKAYYSPIFGQPDFVPYPCQVDGTLHNSGGTYPVDALLSGCSGWKINLQKRYTLEQLIADLQGRTYQELGSSGYNIGINGKMIGGVIHGIFYPTRNMPEFPTGIYRLETDVGCKSMEFELIVVDFSQYKPQN
jgi:hypothetical protein